MPIEGRFSGVAGRGKPLSIRCPAAHSSSRENGYTAFLVISGCQLGSPDRADIGSPSSIPVIITTFPRAVRVIEHTLIPLKDGTTLAARIWLPEDALQNPVPAILEYLPYRKRDGTYERDALTHPYLAGHGYAGVRVDIRGSGESTGLLFDEYAKQEQDDGVELIAWLAAQPWCNGAVGMMGISWGGFNGLQIAARRPPALKAIVTICSTDDRYADDTLLTTAALEWAFSFSA